MIKTFTFLFGLLGCISTYAQSDNLAKPKFGLGLGFTHEKVLMMDLHYQRNKSMFRAGYAFQFNGQKGKFVSEQKANYGRTIIGSGKRYMLFTAGYDYWFTDQFSLGVEGVIGSDVYYTNYSDNRFNGGGYYMNGSSEFAAGGGGKVHYRPQGGLFFGLGYNTLTGAGLSINFSI
ncbi:hypothetical protein GCM10028806_16070 [Spirosoma terrae]|uniref:Porin family protein n=1 Tax=Spirosoma terrae TaxID=1968276 RepID=A0A6L9L3Q0_9BACT|nr:hypothetical protein [Spirosoma terrae]NDU95255.1 hypothetical protein [Spirosoma terrae]